MKAQSLFLFLGILLISQTSCKKIPIPCSGNDCFDIDLFADNLKAQLNGQVGYSYAIYYKNQLQKFGSDGYANTPIDGGDLFTPFQRMNIASISKTITTIAVLQLLEENNLTINSPIGPWLPSNWLQGSNVANLTFKDLLTHNTGFRTDVNDCGNNFNALDYDALKLKVLLGVNLANKYVCYQNINFALFRIIIPQLDGFQPSPFGSFGPQYAAAYISYLRRNVMDPLNINRAACKSPDSEVVFCYPFPDNGIKGIDPGNWTFICGAGGWNLSAIELGRIFASLDQDQVLLSTNMKNEMFNKLLGCWKTNSAKGKMIHHNGGLGYPTSVPNVGAGLASCAYIYPNEVSAVLFINSAPQPGFINTMMENAWHNAWE